MAFFSNRRSSESSSSTVTDSITPANPTRNTAGFETIMGAGCTIEGALRSDSNIRLDGDFTGTLEITGNVLVGETANINADINARNISIAGTVRGNVTGKKVQLLRTARVWGDIAATALATEEGAFIDGKISMSTEPVSEDVDVIEGEAVEDDDMPTSGAETTTVEADIVDADVSETGDSDDD